MYKNEKIIRRYSEAFKMKFLDELAKGKVSRREFCRVHGIAPATVSYWIKKHKRKELIYTKIKVESKDELSRIKELEKEIAQLKKLLLKKDLDALVLDSYLEVAAEDLGYKSVAELKKKLNIER